MAVFDIYSKSVKENLDPFRYDVITDKLKNQILWILDNFLRLNKIESELIDAGWSVSYKILCEEHGKMSLYYDDMFISRSYSKREQIIKYFQNTKENEVDTILDIIHVLFFYFSKVESSQAERSQYYRSSYPMSEAINDLNLRFKENGVGFELRDFKIIRIDNELLHIETIIQTLILLSNEDFKNANSEFISAHEHFRNQRNKECIADCLKSFESVMKVICTKNSWKYKKTDTAKTLIGILKENGFFQSYHEDFLNNLIQILTSGVPTIRNKTSGHGQGTQEITVPDYLASYVLYLTGSTLRFLVETLKSSEFKNPS